MKVRITKRAWQTLVRKTFEFLLAVLAYVPWKPALAWGEWMGGLAYRMSGRYRRVADKNLRLVYGDSLSSADREALIRKMFRNFARMSLVEFLKASYLTPENLARLVRVDSFAPIDDLLARGKGLILVSAHLGNWELLARRAGREGRQVLVVARQGEDPEFNKLTDRLRENGGYTVHPRGDSPRALLNQLRENGIIAILGDQKSEDVFVPFFGHEAGTVAGPAILALKTGAPILPIFCPRQPDGTYRMETLPEIDTTRTKNANADAQRIMADVTAAIETMVRRYPDQWLWMHDRWRMPGWKKDAEAALVESPPAPNNGATAPDGGAGEERYGEESPSLLAPPLLGAGGASGARGLSSGGVGPE